MTLAESSATTVFPTQGSLESESELDGEEDVEEYETQESSLYGERQLRVWMEIERHLHPDEVTHLEQVKQACPEEDHDCITEGFPLW